MGSNIGEQGERSQDRARLARAAERARNQPHLFASLLARYAEQHSLDEAGLCTYLNCEVSTLDKLRLCSRPDPDPASFRIDIEAIAERFGFDPQALAALVREVDALDAFRARRASSPFSSTSGGMLQAARDRKEEEEI